MKRPLFSFSVAGLALTWAGVVAQPLPFREALVSQLVNDVRVVDRQTLADRPAELNAAFLAPDLMQTGRRSRAQLTAADGTIFRIGSNTIFSFEAAQREVNLQQGSILFNSPTGNGGGRIVTASASASVLGTTIIVVATPDGGFKLICLEGVGEVTFPDGTRQRLSAGQMTFVFPGSPVEIMQGGRMREVPAGRPGPTLNFDLESVLENSALLNGLEGELPSGAKIEEANARQKRDIERGRLGETGVAIVDADGDNLTLIDATNLSILRDVIREREIGDHSSLAQALRRDVVISDIGEEGFSGPNYFAEPFLLLPSDNEFLGERFGGLYRGILARNIIFTGGEVFIADLASGSELGGSPFFDFAAVQKITFAGDTEFYSVGSFGPSGNLFFTAPEIVFNQGVELYFDYDYFGEDYNGYGDSDEFLPASNEVRNVIFDATSFFLDEVNFENDFGGTVFEAVGSFIADSSIIEGESLEVYAGQRFSVPGNFVTVSEGNDSIEIRGSTLGIRDYLELSTTGVVLLEDVVLDELPNSVFMKGREIELKNVTLTSSLLGRLTPNDSTYIDLNATDYIALDNVAQAIGLESVNISARTVVLSHVHFDGGIQTFSVQTGLLAANPNTGAAVSLGKLNFINNVTKGENEGTRIPAEFWVSPSVGGSALPGTETIFVNSLSGSGE